MKEEIFRLLKQAYSQLGLGDALLLSRAEMLDALGFVTSENVGDVVAKQKASLEALQRENDSRVTSALRKHDEESKRKADEQKAKEEKAKEEKDSEQASSKTEQEISPELKAYLEQLEKRRNEEFRKQLAAQKESYEKQLQEMGTTVKSLQDASAKAAAEKARAERAERIVSKARELGIPQSRIDEGFALSEDADDTAITEHLSTVKKNIDAQKLPLGSHFQLGGGSASKEEVGKVADALLGL